MMIKRLAPGRMTALCRWTGFLPFAGITAEPCGAPVPFNPIVP
jgi:hypothetical protein